MKTREQILKDNGQNYTFGVKTKEDVVNDIIKETAKSVPQITNYNAGGVFRLFIEVAAAFLEKLYGAVGALIPNRYLQTAQGQYLDWKAEELGLSRRPAVRALGYVVFSRIKTAGNTPVPAGKVLASKPDSKGIVHRYTVIEAAIIEDGNTEALVLVEAENEGAVYNLGAGRITEFATPISGVDAVNNALDWLVQPGADTESDESLRLRCMALWRGLSGANSAAYVSWAKNVDGIGEVKVTPLARGAGTVNVVCTASGNAAPNGELLDRVRAAIEERRPIAADVEVMAPAEVMINPGIHVRFYPAAAANRQVVEEAVDSYFRGLGIGADFEPSVLAGRITALAGIKGVDFLSPGTVQVNGLQIARMGSLTVTVSNDSEE